jgi:hypothetical protein
MLAVLLDQHRGIEGLPDESLLCPKIRPCHIQPQGHVATPGACAEAGVVLVVSPLGKILLQCNLHDG